MGKKEGDGDHSQENTQICMCPVKMDSLKPRRGRQGGRGHLFCTGTMMVAAWTMEPTEEVTRL